MTSVGLSRWKCCRDLAGAKRDFSEALKSFERLSREDPSNLEALRDLANGWYGLGTVLTEAGQRTKALKTNRRAMAVLEALSRSDPTSNENATLLAQVHFRIAELERSQ